MPYLDFDAFRREHEKEPMIVHIFDKDYELPASLPASVMVRILRLQAENGGELPAHEVIFLAEKFMGETMLNELLERPDYSMEVMAEMIKEVIAAYSGGSVPHARDQQVVTVNDLPEQVEAPLES
jgi:hypothetical protein